MLLIISMVACTKAGNGLFQTAKSDFLFGLGTEPTDAGNSTPPIEFDK